MDTEMEISNQEVNNLVNLGYKKNEFIIIKNGYMQLKNVNGYCYFYDTEKRLCKIYNNRPLGCRFYPIILNEKNKCIIDSHCFCYEKNKSIKIPPSICSELRRYVKSLDNEIKKRLKF